MEKIKFFLLHYEDYLNVMIGLDPDGITEQLWELRDKLRKEKPDWRKSEEERAEIGAKVFIKYLELSNIDYTIIK